MKWFIILTLVFLTAYAPVELTRCIIKYNFFDEVTRLELGLIWGFYLCFVVVLERILNLRERHDD